MGWGRGLGRKGPAPLIFCRLPVHRFSQANFGTLGCSCLSTYKLILGIKITRNRQRLLWSNDFVEIFAPKRYTSVFVRKSEYFSDLNGQKRNEPDQSWYDKKAHFLPFPVICGTFWFTHSPLRMSQWNEAYQSQRARSPTSTLRFISCQHDRPAKRTFLPLYGCLSVNIEATLFIMAFLKKHQ